MKRLASIFLWSVIAAAFVGPGTVTTAATSGAQFGLSLLWALVFSTTACVVLQEASARLTVTSNRSLGSALRAQYPSGPMGLAVTLLVLGAVVVGCAAYQAGNILGGVAGATLATDLSAKLLTLILGLAAGVLLWFQPPRVVARLLSIIVAVMGIAFLVTAWRLHPPIADLFRGSLVPALPPGSGLLVLGLLGTTVVPYNLFLGSALAHGESLRDMRWSLTIAIGFGGVISMGILVVGTAVVGAFSFEALSSVLEKTLGGWTSNLFAIGLLGAGFSSAVTAPLAAALTVSAMLQTGPDDEQWSQNSWRYRAVWLGVLVVGVGFGISSVQPIPAILVAQALNGLLLPVVSVFLLRAVNDPILMGRHTNGLWANSVMIVIVGVSILLGVAAICRAFAGALGVGAPSSALVIAITSVVVALVTWPLYRSIRRIE